MQMVPHPVFHKYDHKSSAYYNGKSGYLLFKFLQFSTENDVRVFDKDIESVFILGSSDIHQLFQLMPEHRMISGFNTENVERSVMITHKRNFDNPDSEDQDQCTLTVEQK